MAAKSSMIVGLLMFAMAFGCATESNNNRIGNLEREHQRQVQRLELVKAEIRAAQVEARRARIRATFERCRAGIESIHADVAARQSQCLQQIARSNNCRASKSKTTAGGCLLGVGLAILTGGAAAPWALGGCAAGAAVGKIKHGSCARPLCADQINNLDASVLSDRGLASYPTCSGDSGLELKDNEVTAAWGAAIAGVGNHSAAAEAGMRPGDVLIALNGRPISKNTTLADLMDGIHDAEIVSLAFVRNGQLLTARGRAGYFDAYGKLNREQIWLGIMSREKMKREIHYRTHAMVVGVAGAAADSGIQLGDVILKVDGREMTSAKATREAIDKHPPGGLVQLLMVRGKREKIVALRIPLHKSGPVK